MIGRDPRQSGWDRRSQAVTTVLIFVLVVFLIQLWLLTIAFEEHMAGGFATAIPTFIASGVCFLINLWLLTYVAAIDRSGGEGGDGK